MPGDGHIGNHVLYINELLGPFRIVQHEKPFRPNTPTNIESTSGICRGHKKANFFSLPHELREMIYKECLITRNRLYYRGFDEFRSRYDSAIGNGIKLIDPRFSSNQFAREACEVFYQHNTFGVKSGAVGEFLKIRFENFSEAKICFRPEKWLRKVVIILDNQYNAQSKAFEACHHISGLKELFNCPRLQEVEVELLGSNPVRIMVEIATVCESIQKKIG